MPCLMVLFITILIFQHLPNTRKLAGVSILRILTFGAKTRSLTECQKSKLKLCQRARERSISVKRIDRIRNTTD